MIKETEKSFANDEIKRSAFVGGLKSGFRNYLEIILKFP